MAQFPSANTAYGPWKLAEVYDAKIDGNWPVVSTPAASSAWVEAGTGSTTTALKNNLLYAGLGNTVYGWYNVRSLVQGGTNPKSTTGLAAPLNYSGGNYSAGSTHGMTSSATSQFSSTNGYGTNAFRTAKASAPGLHDAWPSGTRYPGLACFWFFVGNDGMHFIGNADCTSRYLLDDHPTTSQWNWIVVDIYNNATYWNGSSRGSGGGTYTNLFCGFYMGWTNSNTIDAYWHDYRVYEYDASNHTAMRDALITVPSSSYYNGGV